jgi:hypothetical protein
MNLVDMMILFPADLVLLTDIAAAGRCRLAMLLMVCHSRW